MAFSWSARLFIICRGGGTYLVTTMLPTGVLINTRVMVYEVTGPYPLMGCPEAIVVNDIGVWMTQMKQDGFTFRLIRQ
jgi:hypothetical protein